jgi:hypothetical protein
MFSRALRAGYAVLPYGLLALSCAAGLVPVCGGTAETALSGLPARLARFPRPRFVDGEGTAS